MEYQRIISKLDKKLAMYEQLGSPEEISSKLKVELKPIPEAVMRDVVIQKSNALLESARARLAEEKVEAEFGNAVQETISKIPDQSDVNSLKELLSKMGC